ncbi:MAG: glycoside hydrolase family 3 C-terminal domain-containing protein [Clostridia bacterium]|nr:glycoside hydrolase family 3 C-terminal domain-containing protein [Clostridia bacterium]
MKTSQTVRERADALLRQMTLEEKLNVIVETSEAIERLGVPKYYHGNEALHGVVRPGRFTVFPQAIALGAMFDDTLLEKIADAISTEARAKYFHGEKEENGGRPYDGRYNGLLAFWSPDLNLARDPRWGRTAETYGEDPFLAGKNGAAFVRGLQGNDPQWLKAIATPKHFTANNEEHNRFTCNAVMSEKSLREYHLEPFRMAVQEGGCEAVMAAYNAVNGVPCHQDHRLLTDILRDEWGFDGYVVSDCSGIGRLWDCHKSQPTPEDAGAAALNAGVDLECGGYCEYEHLYKEFLGEALAEGKITEERLNEAVRRVLCARIKAGQLEPPETLPWYNVPFSVIGCDAHGQLAYEAAVKSAVLLKNNGILPLPQQGITIAVCGNNADIAQFGDYSGVPVHKPVTPLEGIREYERVNVRFTLWRYTETGSDGKPVPPAFLSCQGKPGVRGSYYDNASFAGLPKTRVDEAVDFTWDAQAPDPLISTVEYSVLWRGDIEAPYTGEYRFDVNYSGCAKCAAPTLTISQEPYAFGTPVHLNRGEKLPFLLRYIKNADAPSCRLLWQITPDKAADDVFAAETAAAEGADAVVAVVGLGMQYEREGRDKTDLSLPEEQSTMLRKLYEVNRNLIVVIENGSAVSIPWIDEHAAAVLEAWYPGERGGTAIADLLFGKVSPSGRLPLGFPVRTDDLPPFDDYEMSHGRTYMYRKVKPLYEFGYGLSYSSFSYSDLRLTKDGVSVVVTNVGGMEADEVTQLYIDSAGMTDQPRWRLKGFRRIHLQPGQSETVSFPLHDESFSLFDDRGSRRVFPGSYTVSVDGHLPDEASLRVIVDKQCC